MAATLSATRQPFAPINGSRLQNLTSLKNRQNALTSPTKRKAATFDFDNDDSENIDPVIFLSPKKSKTASNSSSQDTACKPVNYFLTPTPASPSPNDFTTAVKPASSPRRPILSARSPTPRINTSSATINKPSPLSTSAPAGRSPTRKRIGILNRRRTNSPFTRIDPPRFSSSSATKTSSPLGFSIDAALSGTIPSYKPRAPVVAEPDYSSIPLLHTPLPRDTWFFAIHEDTDEELATNLMEHGACTLDISSDEESAARQRSDRGKENVPPPDDVSQTSTSSRGAGRVGSHSLKERLRREQEEDDACEIDRAPLGEMSTRDFWAEGCDETSVVLVPADGDVAEVEQEPEQQQQEEGPAFEFSPKVELPQELVSGSEVDVLMQKSELEMGTKAALFEGIEKAEEGWKFYESGSEKGE